jgi:hypothetical protein
MARFSIVNVYPPTGFPERLQNLGEDPDPLRDAYIRSSRSVTWLYTEALQGLEVHGDRAELRIFIRWVPADGAGLDVHVWPGRPHDVSAEFAYFSLPAGAEDLDADGRARLVLDAVHTAVLRVAELRGWEPGQFEACRDHVVDRDFVYRWISPWKSAPDRRHRARATYVLGPVDGFGRARLEIAGRDDEEPIATSDEATAYSTQPGFERSARTLRWQGKTQVGLRPYGQGRDGSGRITARLDEGAWTFEVVDERTVRQPTPAMDLSDVPDEEKLEVGVS